MKVLNRKVLTTTETINTLLKVDNPSGEGKTVFVDLETKNRYLRAVRAKLFNAWDIYSKNYVIGIEDATSTRFTEIVNWYKACKDMDFDAITNPPAEVLKYVRG